MLKYFALIYPLGASVLKHLIILEFECPTSGHLTQFLNFLSNPHPLPATLPPGINIDRCIISIAERDNEHEVYIDRPISMEELKEVVKIYQMEKLLD
jgi:hypothetical protein